MSRLPSRNLKLPRAPTSSRPSPSPVVMDNAAIRVTETFKKRRTGLYAIGVAVIAGAGAILGAQLRNSSQARERAKALTDGLEQYHPANNATQTLASISTSAPQAEAADNLASSAQRQLNQSSDGISSDAVAARGSSYEQRQISILQDRRAILMKQKFDLNMKIERVKQKRQKEEAIAAQKGTAGADR